MGRTILRRYSRNVSPPIPWAISIIRGLAEGEKKDYLKLTENSLGDIMARLDKEDVVTLQKLVVSSLTQADVLANLLVEKGLTTEAAFIQKLSA